jgi:hypothetical protein
MAGRAARRRPTPAPGNGREYPPPRHALQDVHRILEATRGAWGHGKTLDEIDAELARMQAEWDREERKV